MSWICVRRFPLEQDLQAVSQFLNKHNVPHRFTEESGQQCLWAPNDEIANAIESLLQQIAAEKIDLKQAAFRENSAGFQAQFSWGNFFGANSLSILSIFIGFLGFLVVSMGSADLQTALLFVPREVYFSWQGGKSLAFMIESFEFWRLLTPTFLHFGIWHILMNGMCIMLIGFRLERYLTGVQYIVLFLFLAVSSNLVQFYSGETPNFGGLSGVVYGYFGFALVLQKLAPNPLVYLPNGLYVWMIAWLLIGMTNVTGFLFSVYMANGAHLGGLIAGVVAAFIYLKLFGTGRSEQIVQEYQKIQDQLSEQSQLAKQTQKESRETK